ncbi:putative NBD/HSP70 family sugar kinase [Streptacidiphilus sp. MAP12-16]|uniref:ROK family protein n=1 Tax=Streptacidiphilus sp. MAP12-16 TaxID=3156300 RepID=UPI0035181F9C
MQPTHTSADRGRAALGPALELVHTGAAPTRSALTSALGVTRATAGAVTCELEALNLITVDSRPAGGTRGRPSHRLAVDPSGPVVLAAQIHADGFTVALATLGGALGPHRDFPLPVPASPERVLHAVVTEAAALIAADPRRCVGLGLAVPTPVALPDRTAVAAMYLDWPSGTPVGDLLEQQVAAAGLSVAVDVANDANLAALAEHRHGAGRGSRHLLYITSGHRGVGGALVVEGKLHTGSAGLALEVGQLTVDPDGRLCPCGNRGCLDVEADPPALLAAAGREVDPARPLLDQTRDVLADAAAGDARARGAVEHVTDRLGLGIAGVINILNPDRVVLGAFHSALLVAAPDRLARVVAERSYWGRSGQIPIAPAVLERSELAGAAELAWAPVLADPLGVLGG